MKQAGRLVFIVVTVLRFGLDEVALSAFPQRWVRALVRIVTVGRRLDAPRGERLRQGRRKVMIRHDARPSRKATPRTGESGNLGGSSGARAWIPTKEPRHAKRNPLPNGPVR